MKRLIAFFGFCLIALAACLFVAGNVHVFEWSPESRLALVLSTVVIGGFGATCPFLDLD